MSYGSSSHQQDDQGTASAFKIADLSDVFQTPLAKVQRTALNIDEVNPTEMKAKVPEAQWVNTTTAYPGEPTQPVALPWPPELPDRLPRRPRVLQLIAADTVSRGLVNGTPRERASNQEMRRCLDLVHATATAVDPHAQTRCAASTETATHHLDILTAARNNCWTVRRGLDGAYHALLEELEALINARMMATRSTRRKRPGRVFNLVILAAQGKIYAAPVRQLRLMGIPCWLIVPGRYVAASLYSAATAVSFIDPRRRI